MFSCTICGAILAMNECITAHSDKLCEEYINCPYCHGECERYKEDEDGEEAC